MNTFVVQFFSPDNQLSLSEVVSLSARGLKGELMILAHHAPYLIYLLPGMITVKLSKQTEKKVIIDSGVLDIINNNCSIITSQIQVF